MDVAWRWLGAGARPDRGQSRVMRKERDELVCVRAVGAGGRASTHLASWLVGAFPRVGRDPDVQVSRSAADSKSIFCLNGARSGSFGKN